MINTLSLLKTKRFLPLFITQFLGSLNDNIFKNALVILITYQLALTHSSNPQILIAVAAGLFILPFFLFSATAGQLADKFEKAKLISIVKLVEVALMALACIGFYTNHVALLMFVLFSLGIQATFFGPLKYAILPESLQENELIAGNGLIEAGTFIAILLGTIIGGIGILQSIGKYLISILIMMVAIGGWISSFYIPRTKNTASNLKINYNFISETKRLLSYAKERRNIFLSILGLSWFWLVGAAFVGEFPALVKDILHANEHIVTLFLTFFSIGLAIGAILCNKLLKGKIDTTFVPFGVLGMTIFTFHFYLMTKQIALANEADTQTLMQFLSYSTSWKIIFDLLMIAISGGFYTVPLYTLLQQRSEKSHRARVIASNNVINALFMVSGAILTMLILGIGFSITSLFLILAIGNAIVTIYICKILPDVLIKSFLRWVLKLLYRVQVKGLENYHSAGDRVIIVANHTSFLDALLLGIFLPDKLTFAVNTHIAKKWWVRLFLRLVDTYPLDPMNPIAIKSLIEFVRKDKKCVIFPEGRLTITGTLMKIYEGPGLIADKAKAKLLPISIQGAQMTPFSRLHGKIRIRLFPKITITILPPQSLEISPDIKGRKRRQFTGTKLYDVMCNAMFESSNLNQDLFLSLLHASKKRGSHQKIIEDIEREPISYKQFIIRCYILGKLIKKYTNRHEHVGILLPNMISTVLVFFALQAITRIPAMLNYSAGAASILSACKTGKVKRVYTSRKFTTLAKLDNIVNELITNGINVIYLEDLRQQVNWQAKLTGLIKGLFPTLFYKKQDASTPAVLLFTSGSEGTPKGVVLSHRNIQANRFQISSSIDFNSNDVIFNALPIFHSFGLTAGMLLPLLSGVNVFLYPSPLHYRIIPELSYDTNATILLGTDTFLSSYAKHAHAYDFHSIRYIFSGAEKLRDETRQTWSQKFGIRIFEGYGATETSPVIAINTPMQYQTGSVGRILPGMQYKLESVEGITNGGILSVKGPNIMKGYLLADQPGSLITPLNGWYNTGDIVSINENGYVTILGRVKRFAKIAGEMVSLTMVEQQLSLLWPDNQHAMISIPDERKGEQLVLVTTYKKAMREEVVAYIKSNQITELAIPRKIIIVSNMPLLGTGKIDYVTVKNEVLNNHLASSNISQ